MCLEVQWWELPICKYHYHLWDQQRTLLLGSCAILNKRKFINTHNHFVDINQGWSIKKYNGVIFLGQKLIYWIYITQILITNFLNRKTSIGKREFEEKLQNLIIRAHGYSSSNKEIIKRHERRISLFHWNRRVWMYNDSDK